MRVQLPIILLISIASLCAACAQEKPLAIRTTGTNLLIPEGIAVNEATGDIYVSSINERKIIIIDKDGKHRDFVAAGQEKFLEGLGMKIDKQRNWLWVANNRLEGKQYTSQLHAFDLATGKMQQYYVLTDTIPHLFNDVVIGRDGKIYMTDTYYSAVYLIDPASQKLELLIKSPKLDYPNGLTFGGGKELYIATYVNGLMMLDPSTKTLTPLKGNKDSTAFALDGLVWWKNSLIGIYNTGVNRSTNAIIQYQLNPAGTAIESERIIERGHELFYEPTTSSLVGNKLYVLANSHLAAYNANNQSVKGVEQKLTPVVVIRYTLK